jgi:hypothetical protein
MNCDSSDELSPMATTIEYRDRDVLDEAFFAIDQRLTVDIIVRGWRVPLVRRAMPLCEAIFGARSRGERHTRLDVLWLGLYGWWSSTLLGIYHHAVFNGMTADWRETDGVIVVSFRPSMNA